MNMRINVANKDQYTRFCQCKVALPEHFVKTLTKGAIILNQKVLMD